jgi:tetratricopeptide (TPR) repeat protein
MKILNTIIGAGCMVLAATFAVAQTDPRPNDSLISQLISQGQFATAQEVLEAGNPTELDNMFFVARVLKASGRTEDAIALFVEILNRDPNYINARRELAHTLLVAGKYDAAQTQINLLKRIDNNPQMQAGYRQMLGVISQNRPIGISGVFAFLPSSNINKGTSNTVFNTVLGTLVIDENSQPVSGVGLQLGVSGYFRKVIDAQSRISLQWSLSANLYKDTAFSSINAEVSVPYERQFTTGSFSIAPYYRTSWDRTSLTQQASGLRFSLTRRVSNQNSLALALTFEERDYPTASYQNGAFSSETLSFSRQISPSLSFKFGTAFEQSIPFASTSAHLAYNGGKLFASVSKAWDGGLRTGFGLEAGYRQFIGDYPLTTTPRADDFYGVNFSLSHARVQVAGFVPSLRCAYTFNASNVAFFDFNVVDCTFGITKEF